MCVDTHHVCVQVHMCRCTCMQIQVCAGAFVLAHMSTGEYTFWCTHMQVHICESAHVCVHIYRSVYVSIWLTIPKKNSSWLFSILQMCFLMFPKTLGNYYLLCFIDGGVRFTKVKGLAWDRRDSDIRTLPLWHMQFPQAAQSVISSGAHSVIFPPCSTRRAVSTVQHTVCLFHSAAHSVRFPQCSTWCVISKGQHHSLQQRSRLLPFSQVSWVRYFYAIPSNMAQPRILHWSPSLSISLRMVHILFRPRMLSVSWFVAPSQSTTQLKAIVYLLHSLACPWHA